LGFEKLQSKLKNMSKYGMDDESSDMMMQKVASDFSDIYLGCTNRHKGRVKPTILTFIYAPEAASTLGATPDGRPAGSMVAHGVTPQSCAMTKGISAAINSCGKLPFEKFMGGASTMWDFDSEWVNEPIIKAVLKTALDKNIQIFQGNTTSVEDLIKAKQTPENYEHLMVRVGGYSARFTKLASELQDEIISRHRHNG
jgi:formate C-acetyltransferase